MAKLNYKGISRVQSKEFEDLLTSASRRWQYETTLNCLLLTGCLLISLINVSLNFSHGSAVCLLMYLSPNSA